MKIFNSKASRDNRIRLRNEMTSAEWKIWEHLRRKQLGVKFRRQYSIGAFVVDFYCPEKKLVIEIDGDSHQSKSEKEYDKRREKFIKGFDIKILRVTNRKVFYDLEGVLSSIKKEIQNPL